MAGTVTHPNAVIRELAEQFIADLEELAAMPFGELNVRAWTRDSKLEAHGDLAKKLRNRNYLTSKGK